MINHNKKLKKIKKIKMIKKLNACSRWRFLKKIEKRLLEVAFNQQSALEPENPIFCGKLC